MMEMTNMNKESGSMENLDIKKFFWMEDLEDYEENAITDDGIECDEADEEEFAEDMEFEELEGDELEEYDDDEEDMLAKIEMYEAFETEVERVRMEMKMNKLFREQEAEDLEDIWVCEEELFDDIAVELPDDIPGIGLLCHMA